MGRSLQPAFAALVAAIVLGGAGPTVKDEMKSVVEPTTNVIFAVGGEVDPSNGPDAAKVAAERWQSAAEAGARLEAIGVAMLAPDQARPGDEWAKDAKQLRDLAETVERAAKVKDGAMLSAAANDLGDTCTACHSKYKTQT
jgi:cytochrome c556